MIQDFFTSMDYLRKLHRIFTSFSSQNHLQQQGKPSDQDETFNYRLRSDKCGTASAMKSEGCFYPSKIMQFRSVLNNEFGMKRIWSLELDMKQFESRT